jgi:tripartite ATP-independent transporter DctP family solute receptor
MSIQFRKVLLALALTALAPSTQAQETIKWRISNQLPATSPISRGLELWKTRMEEAGKGRIKVETYHNSQLYKDSEVFPAVQSGSVEMGLIIVAQLSAYDPIFGIFDLPGLIQSYDQFEKASKGQLGKVFTERLEKLGVVPLYWPLQGFVEIATISRDLNSVADFKGLKLRTHSKELARMAQLVGAAPTVIAPSEVSTALSRNTIDGLTATLSSYYQRKWSEVAQHATLSHFGLVGVVIVANKAAWDRLSPELQQGARGVSVEAESRSLEDTRKEEEDVIAKLSSQKAVLTKFDEKARSEFLKATAPMYEEYFKATGLPGKTLVDYVRSLN